MPRSDSRCLDTDQDARLRLVERLRTRRARVEAAALARIEAVPDQPESSDEEYLAGVRASLAALIDQCLTSIQQEDGDEETIPSAMVMQAHRAARSALSLDTVLRRFTAAHAVVGEFLLQEADGDRSFVRLVMAQHFSLLEHQIARIASEYKRELDQIAGSSEQHRAEVVRRLLAGAPAGYEDLDYELDAWHVAVIATGVGAAQELRCLASHLGLRSLIVSPGPQTTWAWLGGSRRPACSGIGPSPSDTSELSMAVGGAAWGLDGWRLTHKQAQAALRVALKRPRRLTRYDEVALLALALQDEEMARSFSETFLSPLGDGCEHDTTLRSTLRAYFAAQHRASGAAATLDVDRRTVHNRLRLIEQRLGYPVQERQAELELALRLEEL